LFLYCEGGVFETTIVSTSLIAKSMKSSDQLFNASQYTGHSFQILPYNDNHRQQLLSVWEQSVAATHHFLPPADFEEIKEIVATIDFNAFPVFCLLHNNSVTGFIGIADKKVEMLFISPAYIGKGLGRRLMDFAFNELNADEVDVNEQNQGAVNFYRKLGFEVYERTDKDGQGKDYPLLKMRLKKP
jgi:putative acetyltransferase